MEIDNDSDGKNKTFEETAQTNSMEIGKDLDGKKAKGKTNKTSNFTSDETKEPLEDTAVTESMKTNELNSLCATKPDNFKKDTTKTSRQKTNGNRQ